MESACVGVLSIIELKNARWNIEKKHSEILNRDRTNMIIVLWLRDS
jgi:hypothetical protein